MESQIHFKDYFLFRYSRHGQFLRFLYGHFYPLLEQDEQTAPKDIGLAFPRTIKVKKGRQAPVKHTPEADLQEYAEGLCIDFGLHFIHIPNSLLEYVYTTPHTPKNIIEDCNAYINGFPDLLIMDGSKALCVELKTESAQSKLRASQKRFLMGKNAVVCERMPYYIT